MSHGTTTTHRRRYPPENPTTTRHPDPPVTTVENISNHFSRLYLNHKARSSLAQPPPPDATVSDGSTTACLTKSHSQRTNKRGKPHYYSFNKPVKEDEDKIKRAIVVSNKEPAQKQQDLKGFDKVKSKDEDQSGFNEMKKLPKGYDVEKQSLSSIGMMRGRRRSFGSSSQAELTDFFACNGVKVVSADMPAYMQIHVVDVTRKTYDSLEKFTAKTLALTLKKEFDGVYGPAWHCIVGSSFGSFVTHSVGGFMYFSMDQKLYVLLFKTAVQRAH
ncbi:hypothetical protein R6Q59_025386 [Mikania micrantha]|uniref:Dynein light chain n=1 Tax=Mikania micrantha TaxID=192012 RepID=A0A5N6PB94_9ASTR|nr:hypothetical protein E3N88_10616 [Mikania micrantha]